MKTPNVHNPAFRDSAICPKCHEKAGVLVEPPKPVEKIKKNYQLTNSGKTFLIRLTGLILLVLNILIIEMCFHGWSWSFTAWLVQFALGFVLVVFAPFLTAEQLVKISTSKSSD